MMATRPLLRSRCTRDSQTVVIPPLFLTVPNYCTSSTYITVTATDTRGATATGTSLVIFVASPHMSGAFKALSGSPGVVVGDTATLSVTASARQGIAWIGYAIGPPLNTRDSVAVSGDSVVHAFKIRVDSGWISGSYYLPSIGMFARDPKGHLGRGGVDENFLVVSGPRRPEVWAPLNGVVHDVALDTLHGILYLSQPFEERILRLSLATMTFGAPIALSGWPYGLDLSAGADSLFVGLYLTHELGIVDLSTDAVTRIPLTIPTNLGFGADFVQEATNGKVLISVSDPYGLGEIWAYDLNTHQQGRRVDADGPPCSLEGAFGPMTRLRNPSLIASRFNGTLAIYEVAPDSFTWRRQLNANGPLSTDRTGQHLLLGNHLFTADLHEVGVYERETFLAVDGSVIAPDAASAFFTTIYGFDKVRLPDGAVPNRFPWPSADREPGLLPPPLPDNHTSSASERAGFLGRDRSPDADVEALAQPQTVAATPRAA